MRPARHGNFGGTYQGLPQVKDDGGDNTWIDKTAIFFPRPLWS